MKGKKTGGRTAGTPNKLTAAVKTAAQRYGLEALRTLAAIMRNRKAPEQARIAAAKELLDRGHGRTPLALAVEPTPAGSGEVARTRRVIIELEDAGGG